MALLPCRGHYHRSDQHAILASVQMYDNNTTSCQCTPSSAPGTCDQELSATHDSRFSYASFSWALRSSMRSAFFLAWASASNASPHTTCKRRRAQRGVSSHDGIIYACLMLLPASPAALWGAEATVLCAPHVGCWLLTVQDSETEKKSQLRYVRQLHTGRAC